ncbi:MAG: low molecular weight protein-tyrosine-phosphatase [Bacteroidota bacterium]
MKKILFICLGNICRSPMAEGIFNHEAQKRNIEVKADSAGFESYHIGDPPDKRAIMICEKHDIDISQHRVRLFSTADFDDYEAIYAMDHKNYRDAGYFARNGEDQKKVHYLMDLINPGKHESVPDPYLSEEEECNRVYHILKKASNKILDQLEEK